MKIAVAMSGGVDSSVAAALLQQQGHEVFGVTMRLSAAPGADNAVRDAAKVTVKLGIPHFVFDFQDEFTKTVISYFCREYAAGKTPNPCVLCNRLIKFGALWEKVKETGAEALATGHYAGITKLIPDAIAPAIATSLEQKDRYLLKKGADFNKDQSYFLYRLTQGQLRRTLFPLATLTKKKVKKIAQEMALPTAFRPESQEICFIPDNDYAGFLKENARFTSVPGPITDGAGKRLGEHNGIFNYTIGQRKGLGIAAPEPLYVTGIDAAANTVTVGGKEDVYSSELVAGELNWIASASPTRPFKAAARIRYRHQEAEALITPLGDDKVYVKFTAPQMAITPGQSVVFYSGEAVLGGGTILKQGR
jgi:tRNA-uridine 2-sulfurtransferase